MLGGHRRRSFSVDFAATQHDTQQQQQRQRPNRLPLSQPSSSPRKLASTSTSSAPPSARKQKKDFDTAVHDLAEMKLTPTQRKLRSIAREEYTKAHRAGFRKAAPSDGSHVEDRAQDSIDLQVRAAPASPPREGGKLADVSAKKRSVVDFDAELDAFLDLSPPSPRTATRNTTRNESRNTKTVFAKSPPVPDAMQTKLETLCGCLHSLASSMDPLLSSPTATRSSSDSPRNLLGDTLDAAISAVNSAMRMVNNVLLRNNALATRLSEVAEAVEKIEARVSLTEQQARQLRLDILDAKDSAVKAENSTRADIEELFGSLDCVKAECQAIGFGKFMQESVFPQ
ncbi:hypothetical protein HDU82_003424 [Entophlyctis luteolus]|nr:hypothetical protein HDU82_003424 [Entophlyctis luteolus]